MPTIELIYFGGCPHVDAARRNLRTALERAGLAIGWREWDQLDSATPDAMKRHPSPTILIDGRNVSGDLPEGGMCCRTGGAPTTDAIHQALE